MEENKDLTPEDKVRIEQEAAKLFNRWDGGLVNVQTMLLSIAEYATLYERQQQAKEIEQMIEWRSNEVKFLNNALDRKQMGMVSEEVTKTTIRAHNNTIKHLQSLLDKLTK